MKQSSLTIGRLAQAAGVGVETIRYYQRRHLLPTPDPVESAFRHYPVELIDRIRFIKRAQELGFSLDEIAALLQLEDEVNRPAIRELASDRLKQICSKITQLQRMEQALAHLIGECEMTGDAASCPIIATLAGKSGEFSESLPNQ